MKKILLLFTILSLSYANENRMATVSGNAFLNNSSDNSGIKVLFQAVTPSAVTDSVFTHENGNYSIGLNEGYYNVYFSKEDYFDIQYQDQLELSNADYTLGSVTLIYSGETITLVGEIGGELNPDILYIVESSIIVPEGDTLIIPDRRDRPIVFWGVH